MMHLDPVEFHAPFFRKFEEFALDKSKLLGM